MMQPNLSPGIEMSFDSEQHSRMVGLEDLLAFRTWFSDSYIRIVTDDVDRSAAFRSSLSTPSQFG